MQSILIIEDDHSMRVALRDFLESHGWFVFSAANGIDGVATLKRIKPPNVILLDQMMPLMDGEGFLKTIKSDGETSGIPVIGMSATHDILSDLGAVAFLQKPLNLDTLFLALKKYAREE